MDMMRRQQTIQVMCKREQRPINRTKQQHVSRSSRQLRASPWNSARCTSLGVLASHFFEAGLHAASSPREPPRQSRPGRGGASRNARPASMRHPSLCRSGIQHAAPRHARSLCPVRALLAAFPGGLATSRESRESSACTTRWPMACWPAHSPHVRPLPSPRLVAHTRPMQLHTAAAQVCRCSAGVPLQRRCALTAMLLAPCSPPRPIREDGGTSKAPSLSSPRPPPRPRAEQAIAECPHARAQGARSLPRARSLPSARRGARTPPPLSHLTRDA